jgi:hypothetical protein
MPLSVPLSSPRATFITLEFHQVQPINLTDLTHPINLTDPLNRTNLVNIIDLINRPHSSAQHNIALSTTIHHPSLTTPNARWITTRLWRLWISPLMPRR